MGFLSINSSSKNAIGDGPRTSFDGTIYLVWAAKYPRGRIARDRMFGMRVGKITILANMFGLCGRRWKANMFSKRTKSVWSSILFERLVCM